MRAGLFPVRQTWNTDVAWGLPVVIVTEVSCHMWACSDTFFSVLFLHFSFKSVLSVLLELERLTQWKGNTGM